MMPASNKGVGANVGFPDVCLTPIGGLPVPVPYVNTGLHAQASPFSESVMVSMVPGLNQVSEIPSTIGDEPGTLSEHGGPGFFTVGNPSVFLDEMPGINLLCPTTGNDNIDMIGAVVVPAMTNVFYTALPQVTDAAGAAVSLHLDGDCAVITVRAVAADAAAAVRAALDRAGDHAEPGLCRAVLDLRGNGGGVLAAAIDLAGLFLPRGTPVCRLRDEDGDERTVRSRTANPCTLPLSVLVDGATASAAEVVAAALQAAGRAAVLGTPTYGKATGLCLGAGRGGNPAMPARLVVLRADGTPLHGAGVAPDGPLPDGLAPDGASGLLQDAAQQPDHGGGQLQGGAPAGLALLPV